MMISACKKSAYFSYCLSTLYYAVACLFFAIGLAGCVSLSYYDPTTFKNLTDLKAEVTTLYETFANDEIDTQGIASIRLKLRQVYEYERGKGAKNVETAKQVEILQNMFQRHVEDRLKTGKWSETHLNNTKENIEDAFDIAIQTERLKNKNE